MLEKDDVMESVTQIFDSLVELRRYAKSKRNSKLLSQIERAQSVALAEICECHYEQKSDDFHAVMLQVFPEVYRMHS